MCIKDNYNNIHDYGSWDNISQFMDNCEDNCIKYGNCDYYGWLGDRLQELGYPTINKQPYCPQCGHKLKQLDVQGYEYQCIPCEPVFHNYEVNFKNEILRH